MATQVLEQQNGPSLVDPDWASVESVLRSLHVRDRGYVILSRPGRGFVQVAGAPLRLTCEWRQLSSPGVFRHHVLGRPDRPLAENSINTSAGIVCLQTNEILTLEDAVAVFRAYHQDGTVPPRYLLRDVTATFTGGPAT